MTIEMLPEVKLESGNVVVTIGDQTISLTPEATLAFAALLSSCARQQKRADQVATEQERIKNTPPVDRSQQVLTDGSQVPEDRSHTELRENGQQRDYVVLTVTERSKGFTRPYRKCYRHVGAVGPTNPLRDLTDEEKMKYTEFNYVKYEIYPPGSGGIVGKFWTQEGLDRVGKGCGQVTTMSRSIAETYARDPLFYVGTFCVGCGTHYPVGPQGEFVWYENDGKDGPRVGT